jgi:opacity protein-like surface antigen
MKKLFAAVMLILSMNTAQAVTYGEQKLLYMTMHSSILLMLCQFPNAGWELVDVGKTLGNQAGYSDQQLGQLHKKIMAQVTYRLQMQGGVRDIDCDNAVNFHAYAMRVGLGVNSHAGPSWSPRLTE